MTNEDKYIPVVAQAFYRAGFDPAFGCALARQESNWNPGATATNPKDIARGGAFGLCQMTAKTAISLGHKDITPEQLKDPAINAAIAAELCVQNAKRITLAPGQTWSLSHFYADLAAMYNSGRDDEHDPRVTHAVYVPAVLRYWAQYKVDPRVYTSLG